MIPTTSTPTDTLPIPTTVASSAGLCVLAAFDRDYAEYVRRAPFCADGDTMTYAGWQAVRALWAELNAEYEAEIEPLYRELPVGFGLTVAQRQREKLLLREMDWYETLLAY